MARAALDDRRFLFVTGKGGVGKTTVCAALALAMAGRGKRVLVAMCGPHERLSALLGRPPIGHDIAEVGERVWATKIEPERAVQEYGEMVLKVRAVARAVFENRYTAGFFRAVPGLYDWAMLGKAWFHTTETLPDRSPRFDVVLFDAPSTGHGLDMLRVPKVILEVAPPGILRRDAERAWELFHDPKKSGVVVVTIPEEMPTTETIELVRTMKGELELPVPELVVNAVLPPIFEEAEREALVAEEDLLEVGRVLPDAGERALGAAARRSAREALQARCIERLGQELGLEHVLLPFLLGGGTPEGTRTLAAKL
jgi:anion-transporting  ArsA/GET3 family ATPase